MTIALLATGDEIVQGDTLNTNGHAIAHTLKSEGLPIGLHLSCSDNEEEMLRCLKFLSLNHDIIILIGGLGPTSDDRTRFVLAHFLNITLVEKPEALAHIEARLKRAKLKLNSGNRQQALFPSDAVLLQNPFGTAMGCYIKITQPLVANLNTELQFKTHSSAQCLPGDRLFRTPSPQSTEEGGNQVSSLGAHQKLFIMLPGPPPECLPMFHDGVVPVLRQTQHRYDHLLKWRLFGVAEGRISEILDEALLGLDCETGYRLETPYLEFKVRCKSAEDAQRVKDIIEPLVSPHIIASPEQKASARLRDLIERLQVSIVIIDDATGGELQTLIQRPSNVRFLSFHDKKEAQIVIQISGLEDYWYELTDTAVTNLTIDYRFGKKQGTECHQLPFRSALVVKYAAEWLSFRLFHLIDQLHE